MAVIDWHWQATAAGGPFSGRVARLSRSAATQRPIVKGGRIDVISTLYEVSVNLVHAFSANEQTDID